MAFPLLNTFLGTKRWQSLLNALRAESSSVRLPEVRTPVVLLTILIGITPVFLTILDSLQPTHNSNLPTVGFGICAALAIVVRWRLKLPFHLTKNWKSTLSLTHTAVALGCIPAVILLISAPNLLADRHDVLVTSVHPGGPPGTKPHAVSLFMLVLLIAAWVSVVEEVIFRGLMVSVIRRWSILGSQRRRDIVAAVISSLIFGIAHFATWGPIPALALTGLGLGFVTAYIANGEELVPVVLYHFVFDVLSISVSVFS